jgi:hypothetical protein
MPKQHQAVIDRILDLFNKGKINAKERDQRIKMIVKADKKTK